MLRFGPLLALVPALAACGDPAPRVVFVGQVGQIRKIKGVLVHPAQVQKVCDETMQKFGQIDILVNNAGATWGAPTEDYPLEAWDKVMNLNIRSIFLMSQQIGKRSMIPRRRGRIINVASIAGLVPLRLQCAFVAAKAGVVNFTRALALEFGPEGIRANAVSPGAVETPLTTLTTGDPTARAAFEGAIPVRRYGQPAEIAAAVAFLAADEASFVNGANLLADGGVTAGTGHPDVMALFNMG